MPTKDRIKYLLQAWTSRKASPAEEAELFDWVSQTSHESDVEDHIRQLVADYSNREPVPAVDWEGLYTQVLSKRDHSPAAQNDETDTLPVIPKWKRIIRAASVAAILILVAAGSWLYFRVTPTENTITVQQNLPYKNDIAAPATNKATLSVEGGKTIVLNEVKNGSLETAGIAGAFKTADNQLSYNGNTTTVVYQTLSNPKFSKPIQLTLPDGSEVWLNAASSIRFPSVFNGTQRIVSMTGEAYFEVKHDALNPFIVNAGTQVIEDLGTAFNVKAYSDEATIKTTLIEGIVKIGNIILEPGEQLDGSKIVKANTALETAWKDGQFYFSKNSVESILQQAARWYDIEVEYQGKVNETFTVNVDRDLPISKLLQFMEKSGGVRFEIEGNKVIVKP